MSWRSPDDRDWPRSWTTVSTPFGHPFDELGEPDRAHGLVHLLVGGLRSGEGDVVPDGPGEEERLLGDDAELAPQRVQGHRLEVVAVDEHPPVGRVVEAGDQLGQRRLAGPGGPDEGHRLPRGDASG